ncbi:hypothetical protein LCGC14_2682210 [marine sediment metagenome]|uniref:Uncharacterized protein n=1 Tax=marine sediment metagenome TaxID=412755 RepID=A0A0F8ZL14_9ZZZZ
MNSPTHALICCVETDDIGIGSEPHVRQFNSEKEAEKYAVDKLIACGRYAPTEDGRFHSRGVPIRVCDTRFEVLFDYDMNYLGSCERFQVVPILKEQTP